MSHLSQEEALWNNTSWEFGIISGTLPFISLRLFGITSMREIFLSVILFSLTKGSFHVMLSLLENLAIFTSEKSAFGNEYACVEIFSRQFSN
jgi:hypothetical protein